MKKIIVYLILSSFVLVSCKLNGIKGNGNEISEVREIGSFDKIDASGSFEIEIIIGNKTLVEITAESNLMDYIKTKVKGSTLYIYSKESLRPKRDLKINIIVPSLVSIDCSGANELSAYGINSSEFELDLSGASSVVIEGIANSVTIDISGAADLDAMNFITEDLEIDVSGAANAIINSSNSVNAEVSGAGHIALYGNPTDVKTDISGAGSLVRK